jgi:hypothetical protein
MLDEEAVLRIVMRKCERTLSVCVKGSLMLERCREISAAVDQLQGLLDCLQGEIYQFALRTTSGRYRCVEDLESVMRVEIRPVRDAALALKVHLDRQHALRNLI